MSEQCDSGFLTGRDNVIRPDGAVNFADVCLPEEEHADSGLADSAADREGKAFFQDRLLEGK